MRSYFPLYLLAKAPLPGRVKQRLSPPLNPLDTTRVAQAMLDHSAAVVERGWPGIRILHAAPDLDSPSFEYFRVSDVWETGIQSQGDLGSRMHEALADGIEKHGAAVVLGTDIPSIDGAILRRAWQLMESGRQVVGPSQDGGFYLLGLNRIPETLFAGINWGSARVYSRLVANAERCGLQLEPLATLSDCDYYEDLRWSADTVPTFAGSLKRAGFDMRLLEPSVVYREAS